MPLNLDDNKKPYFKQLGLDETFDEIQAAHNALETTVDAIPAPYTPPYKSYVVILTTNGTSAPTVTVIHNELSATPSWSRTFTGTFTATISGNFNTAKTVVFGNHSGYDFTVNTLVYSGSVYVVTGYGGWPTDSTGDSVYIEIRVYN